MGPTIRLPSVPNAFGTTFRIGLSLRLPHFTRMEIAHVPTCQVRISLARQRRRRLPARADRWSIGRNSRGGPCGGRDDSGVTPDHRAASQDVRNLPSVPVTGEYEPLVSMIRPLELRASGPSGISGKNPTMGCRYAFATVQSGP